jgi:hypothetical protein
MMLLPGAALILSSATSPLPRVLTSKAQATAEARIALTVLSTGSALLGENVKRSKAMASLPVSADT